MSPITASLIEACPLLRFFITKSSSIQDPIVCPSLNISIQSKSKSNLLQIINMRLITLLTATSLITSATAGPAAYGVCQAGCAAVVTACTYTSESFLLRQQLLTRLTIPRCPGYRLRGRFANAKVAQATPVLEQSSVRSRLGLEFRQHSWPVTRGLAPAVQHVQWSC